MIMVYGYRWERIRIQGINQNTRGRMVGNIEGDIAHTRSILSARNAASLIMARKARSFAQESVSLHSSLELTSISQCRVSGVMRRCMILTATEDLPIAAVTVDNCFKQQQGSGDRKRTQRRKRNEHSSSRTMFALIAG